MATTYKELYDTTVTISPGVTIQSIVSGGAWQTAPFDNHVTLYPEVEVHIIAASGAVAPSANGTIDVYLYGSVDGTHYPDVIAASEGTLTPTSLANFRLVGRLYAPAGTNQTMAGGPFSVANAFGAVPYKWGVVLVNSLGQTWNATAASFSLLYTGVYGQNV